MIFIDTEETLNYYKSLNRLRNGKERKFLVIVLDVIKLEYNY
jgi:hypothetical protein